MYDDNDNINIKDLDIYLLAPHADATKPPCEVNWRNKACASGGVR